MQDMVIEPGELHPLSRLETGEAAGPIEAAEAVMQGLGRCLCDWWSCVVPDVPVLATTADLQVPNRPQKRGVIVEVGDTLKTEKRIISSCAKIARDICLAHNTACCSVVDGKRLYWVENWPMQVEMGTIEMGGFIVKFSCKGAYNWLRVDECEMLRAPKREI